MTSPESSSINTTRLNELLERHNIPGVSVAVLDQNRVSQYVAGVTNVNTGIPVTKDTIFLIGSITKVLTTTLVMQLVDQGAIDLDQSVRHYLPTFALADPESTERVTVRHLLTHTSGIAGDFLQDFGRGDDAVTRYVESLSTLPILHEVGKQFSYSNSGFMVAGKLVEELTGQTWHDALRTRLLEPLGLRSTVTLPEDALRYSVAVAHRRAAGAFEVGEMWREFHAGAPAGFTPYATPTDLLTFAKFHLDRGLAPDGTRILSEKSAALMQEPQVQSIPSGPFDVSGWGLGWILNRYGSEPVMGHNGGSSASLRVLPERQCAIAVLTNASGGVNLGRDVISDIVQEKFGLAIPNGPESFPAESSTQLANYAGTYQHLGYSASIEHNNGQLEMVTGARGSQPEERVPLDEIDPSTFRGNFRDRGYAKISFLEFDTNGQPGYLHTGLRAYRRIS